MDIASLRNQIPVLQKKTYLMAAAASPLHPVVYRRSLNFQKELFEQGDVHWEEHLKEMEEVRKLVADFIFCSPREVAFVSSSSFAMNIFAMTVKKKCESEGKPLPRVLTMEDEFPSSTLGWLKQGYKVDFIKSVDGAYSIEQIEKSLKPDTGILLTSYVQYSTGFKQSVEKLVELKKRKGFMLALNCTQAMGAFPVDSHEVDFVCASVHKWLMSGLGLAILKISEAYLDFLPLAGWLSQNDFFSMRNDVLDEIHEAKALELGCSPMLQIFSVGSYLKWVKENGEIESISKRILDLVGFAKRKFKDADIPLTYDFSDKNQSGILIVDSKNAVEAEKKLSERNVYISHRGRGLRVAIHYFNNSNSPQPTL